MIYPAQSAAYDFPGSLANPWIIGTIWAPNWARQLHPLGFAGAAAAGFGIAYLSRASVRQPKMMLLLALLSALAIPFLLPKMHERYFLLADMLSLVAAISYASRWTIGIAVGVQLASLLSLLAYRFEVYWPALPGAAFATAALTGTLILVRRHGVEWPRFRTASPAEIESAEARLG
jgi:Gpi18-like mannosyltransferase